MRLRYPGSFLKLLALGFALAALPLLLALIDGFFSLQRLSSNSERAVSRAVSITRDSRSLLSELAGLERAGRQHLVLNDADVLANYAKRRSLFIDTTHRLERQIGDDEAKHRLQQLREQEQTAWQMISAAAPQAHSEPAVGQIFARMTLDTHTLIDEADARIERDLAALREQAQNTGQRMLFQLMALLPIGILLIAGIVILIRGPIRQLGQAIRQLGDGRLDQAITVSGPGDLVALGAELDWLRLRLSELDEHKTRFLRHVSHELKTPLTAIHEGSQLLSECVAGPLNPGQEEIAGILRQNTLRLRQLIENLIDYSNLRLRPPTLQYGEVSLPALFARLEHDHRMALTSKKLQLLRQPADIRLEADADKLRIALDNLLSNAIKYAPSESAITLSAQQRGSSVLIEVCDLGPGIPMDEAERMFQAFVQGEPPPFAAVKGSGLGLSIVRELVSAHGGSVSIRPNTPRGTCLSLRIPQFAATPS